MSFFLIRSVPGGMRTPDRGSTTGAASGTEWPQAMTPAGRAKRVNPPHRHILEKSSCESMSFFLICSVLGG